MHLPMFQRIFADAPIAMALVGEDYKLSQVNEASPAFLESRSSRPTAAQPRQR